jgi:hypothetical protein
MRQRPEGIRDVGLGLAVGFRKSRLKLRMATALNELMERTMDGTSLLWPYRAAT